METKNQSGRRKKNRASKTQHSINTVANPDAAGIDIGAEELVVAVPHDRDPQSVRTFSSFTTGVLAMRDWLVSCGIKTVAVESTGNYWITTYDILEQAGIDVCLVNARHVKGVPGKKTDVCDAQWLQQLHAAGLLKKSFRPSQDIVPLRYLMRHRAGLIEDSSRQIQLMQKVLTEMNLKIQHVFSDLDGVSAQAIITAIVAGERDAKTLAGLRDPRCRSSEQTIIEALGGHYRDEYVFVLEQSQSLWRQQLGAIATCDEQIEKLTQKIYTPSRPQEEAPATGSKPKSRPQKGKNAPGYDFIGEAKRFYGVDLSEIDGVSSGLLSVLMSEVGGEVGGEVGSCSKLFPHSTKHQAQHRRCYKTPSHQTPLRPPARRHPGELRSARPHRNASTNCELRRNSVFANRAKTSSKSTKPAAAASVKRPAVPVMRNPSALATLRPRFSSRINRQESRYCQAKEIAEASPASKAPVSSRYGKVSETTVIQSGTARNKVLRPPGAPACMASCRMVSVIVIFP